MGEWKMTALAEVADVIMGLSPKGDTYNQEKDGIPLLNGPTEFGPHHPHAILYTTDPARFAEPGDLLFCVRGSTTGRMNWADRQYAIGRGIAAIRAKTNSKDTFFAYCCICDSMKRLLSFTSGSVFPNLSTGDINAFKIAWPEEAVRMRIAHILGTLDDKIELNRRMSRTLEKMAAAIFKSWFIDFDPVRRNAARARNQPSPPFPLPVGEGWPTGRGEGCVDAFDAMFPDTFEDSELGPIPKGWHVAAVDQVAEIVKGRSYKSAELQPSDAALVTLKAFLRGGGYREDGLKPYTGRYTPEQVVQPGEMIVAMTDVTQNAEVIGRPAIVMPDARYGVLVASLDTSIVRPTSGTVSTPFLYGLFSTETFRAHTYAHSSGTTVLHLAKNAIPSFTFPCPTEQVQNAFVSFIGPLRARQQMMHGQNRRLAGLRDTLLPKLMSGEIELALAESDSKEVL